MNTFVCKDLEYSVPGFNESWLRLSKTQECRFSKRESQILILLSKELKVCEIAELLGLEKTTVYKHLENARAKMNCNSLLSLGLKLSYILNN